MTFFLAASTIVLLLLYVCILLFYTVAWKNIPGTKLPSKPPEPTTFISLLIPARNEENTISALLLSLEKQTYPPELFEVIVIDDFSTDATAEVVSSFSRVKLLSLENFLQGGVINSYKKKAIEIGIQQSRGSLLITTDADCIMPPNWLSTIADYYTTYRPQLMVMPVAIQTGNKAIEIFQALDFMSLQGITGAGVYSNQLNMCNGANLAYTREAFDRVNGFKGIDAIASGDDMLLMNKIAKEYPGRIRYIKSADVIVQTAAVTSISAFFNQRIRWASKSTHYEDKNIFYVLLLVYLLNVFLFLWPVVSLITTNWAALFQWFSCILVKIVAELLFLFPVARFFKQEKLLAYFPLAQPFHILYTIVAGWLGKFGRYQWKDRTVK